MFKNLHTKLYIAIGILICTLCCMLYMIQAGHMRHIEESPLYKLETAYRLQYAPWKVPEEMAYPEDSAEAIFLQGIALFDAEKYAEAEAVFQQALTAEGKDPALPTYLYYYINQCIQQRTDEGEFALVSQAMEEAAKYSPLANDEALFWNLVSSAAFSAEEDQKMIGLLENYLENTKNLELRTVAWLKNCIGMLQYNNKEYANAIRNFYDVELLLEEVNLTATAASAQATEMEIGLAGELRYAKEYIANIYYIFGDYEQAAALYWELAETASKDKTFYEYSACINMASACLDYNDTEGARKAMALLEQVMPNIEEADVAEVEAHRQDVFANIYMKEGNLPQADACLKKAEAYYAEYTDDIFLGGKYFVELSRCKYLVQTEQFAKAQTMLEALDTAGIVEYYGMEKDVYKLLREIYEKTGQDEKLLNAYQHLLEKDEDFVQTVQREYLEFSEYYRENNELKEYTTELNRKHTLVCCMIVVIVCILCLTLVLLRSLRTKNLTDQLTGVYNRKKLEALQRQYQKEGTPANIGVAMIDIDYFKRYNDTYGHPAGDEVLREVAQVLKSSVRKQDIVIRYGGEEFLLLLQGVQAEIAQKVCERVQMRLQERAIPHEASDVAEYVTISVGVCHQQMQNQTAMEALITQADHCLYQSKENGRNRVTVQTVTDHMNLEK